MEHHPDKGGDTATMQEINKEYAFASAKIISGGNFNAEDTEKHIKFSEEYQKVIAQIINLEGITISLVGWWIWVEGNTYPVRKQLKEAGLTFAPKKMVWYFRGDEFKALRGSKKSLDEIKSKYGSDEIKTSPNFKKSIR